MTAGRGRAAGASVTSRPSWRLRIFEGEVGEGAGEGGLEAFLMVRVGVLLVTYVGFVGEDFFGD